jgi:tetratricopeptide (TPR) repeat protein
MIIFAAVLVFLGAISIIIDGFSIAGLTALIAGIGLLTAKFVMDRNQGLSHKKAVQAAMICLCVIVIVFAGALPVYGNSQFYMNKIVKQSAKNINRGNFDKAEKLLKDSGLLYEENEIFHNLLALYIVSQRYDDAKGIIKKKPADFHLDSNSCFNVGMMYYQTQDYKRALEYFEKAVFMSPDFYEGYIYAGNSLIKCNSDMLRSLAETSALGDSEFYFQYALRVDDSRFEAHLCLGENYLLKMDYKNANYHLLEAEKRTSSRDVKNRIDELKEKAAYYMNGGAD